MQRCLATGQYNDVGTLLIHFAGRHNHGNVNISQGERVTAHAQKLQHVILGFANRKQQQKLEVFGGINH